MACSSTCALSSPRSNDSVSEFPSGMAHTPGTHVAMHPDSPSAADALRVPPEPLLARGR
mgnify:CR=1 FL=1